jgi:hypothetical protein
MGRKSITTGIKGVRSKADGRRGSRPRPAVGAPWQQRELATVQPFGCECRLFAHCDARMTSVPASRSRLSAGYREPSHPCTVVKLLWAATARGRPCLLAAHPLSAFPVSARALLDARHSCGGMETTYGVAHHPQARIYCKVPSINVASRRSSNRRPSARVAARTDDRGRSCSGSPTGGTEVGSETIRFVVSAPSGETRFGAVARHSPKPVARKVKCRSARFNREVEPDGGPEGCGTAAP